MSRHHRTTRLLVTLATVPLTLGVGASAAHALTISDAGSLPPQPELPYLPPIVIDPCLISPELCPPATTDPTPPTTMPTSDTTVPTTDTTKPTPTTVPQHETTDTGDPAKPVVPAPHTVVTGSPHFTG